MLLVVRGLEVPVVEGSSNPVYFVDGCVLHCTALSLRS